MHHTKLCGSSSWHDIRCSPRVLEKIVFGTVAVTLLKITLQVLTCSREVGRLLHAEFRNLHTIDVAVHVAYLFQINNPYFLNCIYLNLVPAELFIYLP